MVRQKMVLGPQPGPQTKFFATKADIAIFGGSAGGGKSYALLLEPLRHLNNPNFGAVIFRRNTTQVRNEGGLWDESLMVYTHCKGNPKESKLKWEFPSGMSVRFSHLEYERSVYDWQGSQIPFIGFDELTHFSQKQFWYMLSRNRSGSSVPGYIRATCNPDVDSWVRKLIDWWIGEDGYPIQERSGVIRYFVRVDDVLHWGDSKEELAETFNPEQYPPKSLTFIPSRLEDNKILMAKDPSYYANLMALPRVERMRLHGGNWNIRASAGDYFKREDFEIIPTLPAGWLRCVRYWDRASTKPSTENPNPDWTRGVKMYSYPNGLFVVAHVASTRDTPLQVEKLIKNTATQDGFDVRIVVEQDPGQAGQADVDNYIRQLAGYDVRANRVTKDKVTRALAYSAQSEAGNIKLLQGEWNEAFITEHENFPPKAATKIKKDDEDLGKDDQVDAGSGAFNELATDPNVFDSV